MIKARPDLARFIGDRCKLLELRRHLLSILAGLKGCLQVVASAENEGGLEQSGDIEGEQNGEKKKKKKRKRNEIQKKATKIVRCQAQNRGNVRHLPAGILDDHFHEAWLEMEIWSSFGQKKKNQKKIRGIFFFRICPADASWSEVDAQRGVSLTPELSEKSPLKLREKKRRSGGRAWIYA